MNNTYIFLQRFSEQDTETTFRDRDKLKKKKTHWETMRRETRKKEIFCYIKTTQKLGRGKGEEEKEEEEEEE